ncbi:hypothetical protein Dda_7899 [Drechslerella dactyloides]|uniref:MYND-type domain-containing protein n=1 Tax=Drechslerella dactyloides TaxID=74499 RepID=A0AAD6IRD9_DREDA|nr:hypothetical protein Dda_7899 [Drechslerella dactyloides]
MSVIIDDIDPNFPMESILAEPRIGTVDACAVCNNPTAFLCTFCHGIFYCTDAHSAQDEANHALICRAGAAIPKRPVDTSRNYIAVLVFPEFSKQPYYAWTSWSVNVHGRPVFDQSMWFGGGYRSFPRFMTVHPVTRQPFGNAIMYFQKEHADDKAGAGEENLCVYNFTGGKGGRVIGPLLFLAVGRSPDRAKEWLVSFLPSDMPLLLHELKERTATTIQTEVASVKAMVCYPDDPNRHFNAADNHPKPATSDKEDDNPKIAIEALDIPANHPIFAQDLTPDNPHIRSPTFAAAYRFPIRVYAFPPYTGTRNNTLAASLFPTTAIIKDDPTDSNDAGRPIVTSASIPPSTLGAVLIARADGKPLEVPHVLRFVEFGAHLSELWSRYGDYRARKAAEYKITDRILAGLQDGEMKEVDMTEEDCKMVTEMYESLDRDAYMEYWDKHAGDGDEGPFEGVERPWRKGKEKAGGSDGSFESVD